MKYLFTTLLIINSLAYLFISWYSVLFVLASIVALSCVIKVNNKQTLFFVITSTLSGAFGIVFALALQNGKIFVLGAIYFFYFLVLSIMAIEDKPKCKDTPPSPTPVIEKPKPEFHRYKIDTVINDKNRLKHFFDIVDEYYSADEYWCDEYTNYEVLPYYKYRKLPCRLEESACYYHVYVETKLKCWEYIGTLFRSSVLEDSLSKAEYYHVKVSGGTHHIFHNGKNDKEWLPLEFTLVICLRNEDQKD